LAYAAVSRERDPYDHFVQLYEADKHLLAQNVARFLFDGLERGGTVLAVATPEHRSAFIEELATLGADAESLATQGRLLFLDGEATLTRIMSDGFPDGERFENVVGRAMREASARAPGLPLIAYGEMVGILWQKHQFPAAIRLEQLWNKLRESLEFTLFCSYPIDVFGAHFDVGVADALLCAHSRLLPGQADEKIEQAIDKAMEELMADARRFRSPTKAPNGRSAWATLPKGAAAILWVRENFPDVADEILLRAKSHYSESLAV